MNLKMLIKLIFYILIVRVNFTKCQTTRSSTTTIKNDPNDRNQFVILEDLIKFDKWMV